MKRLTVFLIAGCVFLGQLLFGQQEIPKIEQRVNDFTNTLSYNEWKSIENLLKKFEDSTSTQIAVVLINSLDGQSIEQYATKVFEKNKIGQTKKDNGVLLVISKGDRGTRIEVGYGLEGVLTDALCSQIIEKEIDPQFKQGNFYGGIATGVTSIIGAVSGEYKAEPKGKVAPAVTAILLILFVCFFLFVLIPLAASRRRTIIGSSGWNRFSGWGYRGGWGRGGFGGGSSGGGWSGGGGMSGGGGATGHW